LTEPVPTRFGDVLILLTDQSIAVHAVGQVMKDGQQHFHAQANAINETDAAVAIALAKKPCRAWGRMFIRNLDAVDIGLEGGDWLEISN
jgi:hypothetical protein